MNWIHELHSFPEVDQYNTLGIPVNIQQTKEIIKPWIQAHIENPVLNYTLAVSLEGTGENIGLFGLKLGSSKFQSAEIWYKLHPKSWGNGYATESVKSVLKFGFE
ncbi:MAG: GNAT family N-acetyltransferase, partial [Bacteroidota bacterium]